MYNFTYFLKCIFRFVMESANNKSFCWKKVQTKKRSDSKERKKRYVHLHNPPLFQNLLLNPPASSSVISGAVRSDIIIDLGAGTVGGGGNPSLVSSMPLGVSHGPDDSVSAPPSSDRGKYLPTQSQASYHSASSSPLARRPSSGFDGVNDEADHSSRERHRRWACRCPCQRCRMTEDNDDGANVGDLNDILSDILALHPGSQLLSTLISLLSPSTSPTASHALHYSLYSPPSHLPSPLLLLLLLLGSPSEIQEFSLS